MPALLNDAFYPILLMALDEPLTAQELDSYLAKLVAIADEGIYKRKRHVVVVTNDPTTVSAAMRRKIADAVTQRLTPEQVDVTLASFLPIDSALVRGAITAFRWFSPETVKTLRVVATMQIAFDQALKALDEHGTPFTGDRRALAQALGLRR